MTKNLDKDGLRSIVKNYDLFFIDLWGVVHNGINLHEKAIETLEELNKSKKNYVLLTNAPRPNSTVKTFLKKLGMENKILENVYTSGQAALSYLKKNHVGEMFYHVGPPRDFDLFYNFEKKKTKDIKLSNYILCTGLFDDHSQDLNYYKDLLSNHTNQRMICTNPDLIVDRGDKRELCAGSVAMVFEKMGGKVVWVTVAGRSNALSGVVAANTRFPVIGCPPFKDKDDMMVNINSTIQCPSKVPVMTILEPGNVALSIGRMFGM